MYYILYNLYSNLGILSSIKIKMPYLSNINNLYFDMDISLYNYNILDIFVYVILLLLLLLLTIIYYSSIYGQEKILVNFNESPVGIYDSGDDIDCSSSSDEGNYTSGDSDDGEDDDIKLSRRRRRWDKNREYVSKYSGSGKAYNAAKNNNKNYNTYARAVKDEFYAGQQPGIPRNHLLDKKMYKDTVRELNKANIQNPNLNLDLDTLSRVHANRYHKLLYKKYDYANLSVEQMDIIANRHNIKSLTSCKDFLQSIDSDKLRVYLNVSEKIHEKYTQRTYLHTSKWDGWFVRQIAKIVSK